MTNAVRAARSRRLPDPWLNGVRCGWLVVAILPGALSATGAPVIAASLVWVAWAMVAVGTLVAHPWSLTVVRFVAPLVVAHAGWRVVSASDANDVRLGSIVGFFVMLAVALVTYSASYGAPHAQAAAYGHERRHLLRPPVAVLLPLVVLWTLVAVAAGVAADAESQRIAGVAAVAAAALLGFALRRASVLARRWLVFVPAGIAVHDPLVLRDTFMVRGHDVRTLHAAPADTQAFDATGTTWGIALELVLARPHDVTLSNFGARVSGTLDRLHVTSLLVAPSRPAHAAADRETQRA